ncbi:hypothetical protein MANES_02G057100v8 [Manihot esculenta]|uniref:Uncharacterized protein n=1 Tax=Manihot esculenta TaxID=3983 RepID=A0A2C9WDJ5_MANES|nr:hypothetical protein MANES_02G057100v8 [Manihot esculenta]
MRGLPALHLLLVVLIVCITRNSCRAAFLQKGNTTSRCEDGHLDECLIAEDFEIEVLMDSYITRILGDKGDPYTDFTYSRSEVKACSGNESPSYNHCQCPSYNPNCGK